jgi:hypothetical protein
MLGSIEEWDRIVCIPSRYYISTFSRSYLNDFELKVPWKFRHQEL